jgi:hypothetical protein
LPAFDDIQRQMCKDRMDLEYKTLPYGTSGPPIARDCIAVPSKLANSFPEILKDLRDIGVDVGHESQDEETAEHQASEDKGVKEDEVDNAQ